MPKVNYGVVGDSYITPAQRAQLGLPFTGAQYRYEVLAGGITPVNPPPPPWGLGTSWYDGYQEIPSYGGGNGDWLNTWVSGGYGGGTLVISITDQTILFSPQPMTDITIGPNGVLGTQWDDQRAVTGQNGRVFGLAAVLVNFTTTTASDTTFQVGEFFVTEVPPLVPEALSGVEIRMMVNATGGGLGGAFNARITLDYDGSRTLNWGQTTNAGGTITGYSIAMSSDNGVNWTPLGTASGLTFDLSSANLTPLSEVTFGVATITNNGGTGSYATIKRRIPPARSGAPSSVTGSEGDGQVSLTWSQPASTGSYAITDYRIQYSSDNGSTWTVFSDSVSSATSAVVSGLTNGTSYKFRVAAITAAGVGAYSAASSSYTPTGTPVAPGAPTGVSGTAGDQQVSLSWSAPGTNGGSAITDYVVQYSSNSGSSWTTFSDGTSTNTSALVTGLTNGTSYVFRVAATNAIGTGDYSTASSAVTPATVPGAPTSVSGTAGNAQVSLTWTAPASDGGSSITDYVVQYSSNSGSSWSTFSDGTSTSTSAVVTGLTNGTQYVFRVAAVNATGTGSYSSASSGVTPLTTPGAPTGVTATPGDAEVSLSWTAPSSNGGSAITDYVVQYSSNSGSSWSTFSDGTSTTASTVVTGLTNDTAYVFRVAAVSAVGTGSYSSNSNSATPTAPSSGLAITVQPKNDISRTSTQSVTFSLTATDSGQTLSYQWQYYGMDQDDWTMKWLNTGSNSNTYTFTGQSAGFSLDMYQTDVKLRCIVSTTGASSPVTSDVVHWVMMWGLDGGVDFQYEGSYQWSTVSGTVTVNGETYSVITPTYSTGEMSYDEGVNPVVNDYSYVSFDLSWYSSNMFTLHLQSSPDASTWTNIATLNSRGGFPVPTATINRPGGTTPMYYRYRLTTNWPPTTTNGTSSSSRSVSVIYYGRLKVNWGA